MILHTLALKLERQAQGDFKGRHFEAMLVIQAVSRPLRCLGSMDRRRAEISVPYAALMRIACVRTGSTAGELPLGLLLS